VPGRGAGHPRDFALAPGGDSGAVPTTIAIRAGAEWLLQTDAGTQKENSNMRLSRLVEGDPTFTAGAGGFRSA
jgi:hypothetical protein